MAKGQPDFGALAPTETVVGISDMGELAARLGSIVTFDRRGNVIFLEDFKGSLAKCAWASSGTGAGVSITSLVSRTGDFACQLVTGNLINKYASIWANVAYPVLSRLGVEVCWWPNDDDVTFELLFRLYDGAQNYNAWVRWEGSLHVWQYWKSGVGWTTISDEIVYYPDQPQFNYAKLVADFITEKYVRLIVNDETIDMSDKVIGSGPSSEAPHLMWYVRATTNTNANKHLYLDNVIVTQNEP